MSADYFGLLVAGKKTPIPLRDVSVNAEIQGYVLGLKSVLTYLNDSPDPIEVLFKFPLEDSYAVVGLTAVIDGRKIKAEIREKEEARAAYDDAIASGQSAALGEEKSGDVFSISLGNLPPQKSAEVHLELVGELPIDAEHMIRFSLPSTLKPRYTPAGSVDPLAPVSGVPTSQVEHSTVSSVNGFKLSVLNASAQVADVTSPTHSLKTVKDAEGDCVIVTLSEGKFIDSDLVIQIEHKNLHQPTVLTERGKDGEGKFMNDQAVMVNFFPDFKQIEAACEFIFLIDRSGSMSGSYIKSARETLILFLKSLPENSRFNIIGFGSRFEKLFPENSVSYMQETLDTAMAHLQNLQADLGGTELLPPLEAIFRSQPSPGFSRQVFVLTDGSVSNTDRCIQKVKDYSGFARCFTFGIGSGASTSLVEGLARAGNGASEFVKEGERMQPKVIRSLKRALQPSVTDVSVEFKVPGQECKVLQSPDNLPPIYNGEKLVVYGVISAKLPFKGTAILKGQMGENRIEQHLSFEIQLIPEKPSLPTIHHLAAKALIKDWQSQKKSNADVIKLSIEGSVISSHTAFIAVNEESLNAVSGAMLTYDLQAAGASYNIQALQDQVSSVQAVMAMNIDKVRERGDTLDDLVCKSEALNSASLSFSRSAKKTKGGGFGGFFSSLFGKRNSSSPSLKAAAPPIAASMDDVGTSSDDDESESLCEEAEFYVEENFKEMALDEEICGAALPPPKLSAKMASAPVPAALPPPKLSAKMASAPVPTDTLTALINAQQANGSWAISSTFSNFLGKPLKELEDASPEDISSTFWATVLILTLLKKKFSGQQEEWELIAMKANSWLKKQALPSGISLDNVFKTAEKLL